MIVVPGRGRRARGIQIFADSHDARLRYVDALAPAPMRDRAPRWMELPGGQVLLTAELRFGPDEDMLRGAAGPGLHTTPAPWDASPVCAWAPAASGAQLLARGTTSGYGAHNVVLSATLPEYTAVLAAADLSCRGRLEGARIRASLPAHVQRSVLERAAIGGRAAWDQPLGAALVALIDQLLAGGAGALAIEGRGLPATALAELRELARLELAHQVMLAWLPRATSLAFPATLAGAANDTASHDVEFTWTDGDSVPVRAVRTLRIASKGDTHAQGTRI